MPTDNPKISLYVPQAVYDRFNQFKDEQGLSMSQAGIVILAEYFEIEEIIKETTKGTTIGGVTLARVEALERNCNEFRERLEKLEFDSSLLSEPENNLLNEDKDLIHQEPESELQDNVGSLPLILSGERSANIQPIAGGKLSEFRLKLSKAAVSGFKRRHSTEEFTEWSRKQDPDGIGWEYVTSPNKGYLPVGELSSEQKSSLLEWIGENLF